MKKAIVSVLESKGPLNEKKLRKNVLKSMADKDGAETHSEDEFSSVLAKLIAKKKISLEDELYSVLASDDSGKRKRTSSDVSNAEELPQKKTSKEEKVNKAQNVVRKAVASEDINGSKTFKVDELWKNGEKLWRENGFDPEYLRTNPDKVTRLFCGNLNKKVSEEELKTRLTGITFIKWITDKQTGEFYGSSFLEMKDPASAALAVLQDKTKFLGRPLKIYYCPPKPGDRWPPHSAGSNMGNPNTNPDSSSAHSMTKKGNEPPRREKTEKPEGCRKLFAGNLSYNIDDETIVDFFKDCGELVGLRWLTRQGTEEFRGAGYVEFATAEQADAAMLLDGRELLGRNIRLDWTN